MHEYSLDIPNYYQRKQVSSFTLYRTNSVTVAYISRAFTQEQSKNGIIYLQ